MCIATKTEERAAPWNKGKLIGQKAPLKLKEIWAIRFRLQLDQRIRISPCSTSPLTASYVGAISLDFASTM
jgi:hypothetical protein